MINFLNKRMHLKSNIVTSLKYIFFEGLSKGGEQLILIFLPLIFSNQENSYLSILLLISLSGIVKLINPINDPNAIIILTDKFKKEKILNTVFLTNLVVTMLCLCVLALFRKFFLQYYNIENFYPIFFLVGYMFLRIFFLIFSYYELMFENHNKSLFIRNAPFLLTFLLQIFFIFIINTEIVFGFFISKFLAFLIIGGFLYFKGSFKPKLEFDREVFNAMLKYSSSLWVNTFIGWLLGYGILNFSKAFLPDQYSILIGRMINLWMILLLIANGINSIYLPILKKALIEGIEHAIKLRNKVQYIFLSIAVIGFVVSLILLKYIDFEDIKLLPYIFVIFFGQSFYYVSSPFYFLLNRYKRYVTVNSVFGALVLIYTILLFNISEQLSIHLFLGLYLVIYFIRSLGVYLFSLKLNI